MAGELCRMKNYRLTLPVSLLLLFLVEYSSAQDRIAGLYRSPEEFMSGRLSFQKNDTLQKIRINPLFYSDQVIIEYSSKKIRLSKDSIYGYTTASGAQYRFYGKSHLDYQILECRYLCIYKALLTDYSTKIPGQTEKYFFSLNAKTPPVELTIEAIKKLFLNHCSLEMVIDSEFKTDDDLRRFNSSKQTYQLNYLLSLYL